MREMKDSGVRWIGKIPTKWTIAKAKNCVEIQNGSDPKTEGSIPVYGSGSMSFKTCGEYKEGPSVLIGRKGATLHIPHYISSKFWNVDTAFNVYSKSIFDLKYYFYCAHVFDYTLYMSQTTLPSMTQTAYENMFLPLPTQEEQYAIANQLDQICSKIDAVLEKTRASIEEYKKLKQAVITQAVTKGVRGDRPMKDSGIEWIGDIPAEWEIRKIFRAINKVGDIDHYMPDSVDDGIPYLMTGDLQEKLSDVNLKRCKKVSFQDYEMLSSKIRVSKGDVIFARYATIGTVCFVDTEDNILVSYACLIIKPNSSLLYGEFLFYYLKSTAFLEEIKQYIKANTQANVGLDSVSKAKIALPSVLEQQKIVEYLRDKCKKIDTLIAKKQQYLTEIENYKKSLIYEYVTGKKEVV